MENEYLTHMLFFCPASRAVWFMSQLALKVDHVPLHSGHALKFLQSNLPKKTFSLYCNIIWCIWKARNEVIEGNTFRLEASLRGPTKMDSVLKSCVPCRAVLKHSVPWHGTAREVKIFFDVRVVSKMRRERHDTDKARHG